MIRPDIRPCLGMVCQESMVICQESMGTPRHSPDEILCGWLGLKHQLTNATPRINGHAMSRINEHDMSKIGLSSSVSLPPPIPRSLLPSWFVCCYNIHFGFRLIFFFFLTTVDVLCWFSQAASQKHYTYFCKGTKNAQRHVKWARTDLKVLWPTVVS